MKIKKTALLSLVLAFILLLGACSSSVAPNPDSPSSTPPETQTPGTDAPETDAPFTGIPTRIEVWTKDRHDLVYMEEKIAEFEAANPDIDIVYEPYTDNYQQVIELAATNGQLPDIVCVIQSTVNALKGRGDLVGLNDYLTDEMKAVFTPDFFIEGVNMLDGQIVSLPNTGNTIRLVVNNDLLAKAGFNAPPKSIEEMAMMAKTVSDKFGNDGIYGFALPLKNPTSGFQRGVVAMPSLSGLPIRDGYNFVTGKFDWGSYVPAIEVLKTMWNDGSFYPGCESLEIDPLRTAFAMGEIAMYMTYSHSEYGVYKDQFPMDPSLWSYEKIPSYSGTIEGSQGMSAGTWYGLTANSKNPDEAWRVMEFLYSVDLLSGYYEGGFGVSVVPAVVAASEQPDSIKQVQYMGLTETDKMWPLGPQGLTVPTGGQWGDLFFEYMVGRRNDIDAIVNELNATYDAAVEIVVSDTGTPAPVYPSFKASDPAGTAN